MATDNELLTEIRDALLDVVGALQGDYDDTEGDSGAVSDALSQIAAASAVSRKALVLNTHASVPFDVYEDGKLVAEALLPGEAWISDLDGGGIISVQCGTGEASTYTFTRYIVSA